jgi:16S rRNA (guanine(1405)-N(7))-methyltransferase
MKKEMQAKIEELTKKIKASKKYKIILEETIKDVLTKEYLRHKSLKIAEEMAKKKLHRIRAEYLGEPNYKKVKEALTVAFANQNDEEIREVCWSIFTKHSSTRERNHLLDEYYRRLFEVTGKPDSIADLACALNPLSFRWMGLGTDVKFYAYDVNEQFIDLINFYFELEGLEKLGIQRDVYSNPPEIEVDVAFLFKMYYCLEHRLTGAGLEVVKTVPAKKVLISFPTVNLVAKKTDILGNHEEDLKRGAKEFGWKLDYIEFDNEVVVVVEKSHRVTESQSHEVMEGYGAREEIGDRS